MIMRTFIFLAFIIAALGCKKNVDSNACNSKNSIHDIPWIVELKNSITNCSCKTSVIKGTFEGKTVFYIGVNDPICNGINTPTLFNCEGKAIRTFTSSEDDQNELRSKLKAEEVLYTCRQ
jgi:hypothetical protein